MLSCIGWEMFFIRDDTSVFSRQPPLGWEGIPGQSWFSYPVLSVKFLPVSSQDADKKPLSPPADTKSPQQELTRVFIMCDVSVTGLYLLRSLGCGVFGSVVPHIIFPTTVPLSSASGQRGGLLEVLLYEA